MDKKKVIMSTYDDHCSYNTPFFGIYGQKGSEMHCHTDFYEICLIIGGSYEHTYSGKQHTVKIGHLLYFQPGESHSLISTSPNSYHYAFLIKKDYFIQYCTEHQANAKLIMETPNIATQTSEVQFAYLSFLASRLVYHIVQEDTVPLMHNFLSTVLATCFCTMPSPAADQNKIYATDLFQLFNNYEGLDEDITNLYANYPISRTALIEDFKNLTGYTIVQYRNLKRLEYAAHLLTEANFSITNICNMLNLENPSHFSKQFKKRYGISPKQYQILHRSKHSSQTTKEF